MPTARARTSNAAAGLGQRIIPHPGRLPYRIDAQPCDQAGIAHESCYVFAFVPSTLLKRFEPALLVRKSRRYALPYSFLARLAAHLDDLGKMPLTDLCNRHFDTSTLQSLDSQARGFRCEDRLRTASSRPEGPADLPENGVGPPCGNPAPGGDHA